MIRIFHTRSGTGLSTRSIKLGKTSSDSVFKAKNVAFAVISENGLKNALKICSGMASANSGGFGNTIIDAVIFTGNENVNIINAAKKALPALNAKEDMVRVSLEYYAKLSDGFAERLFAEFDYAVFFTAIGVAVRLIAPFLKSKFADPGVIAIDENGKFAVSLLSGHAGGANRFALEAAGYLGSGAVPVITTATDAMNRFSLDMFAEEFGLFIEDRENKVKTFNKASLRGEKFKIFMENGPGQDAAGSYIGKFSNAEDFSFTDEPDALKLNPSEKIIAVSARDDFKRFASEAGVAVLRPKRVALGIGCNKNTDEREIEDFVLSVLEENNISPKAVSNIATIDIKAGEKGILKFGEKYAEFIDFFSKEEINAFMDGAGKPEAGKPEAGKPSLCFKHTGAYSVCEPCALLSAKNETGPLLITKSKKGNVTVAAAFAE